MTGIRLLIVLQATYAIIPPLYNALPVAGALVTKDDQSLPIAIFLCTCALLLRHTLAAARGEKPRAWKWTLAGMAVLNYAGLPLVGGWDWTGSNTAVPLLTSILVLLRGHARWLSFCVVSAINITLNVAQVLRPSSDRGIAWALSGAASVLIFVFLLYAAVLLIRRLDDLRVASTELARAAVSRDRMRVSRDLHDVLGHNLTAISVTGDLARRALVSDRHAGQRRVEDMSDLVERARVQMGVIPLTETGRSIPLDVREATALLRDAGISTHVDLNIADLSPAVRDVCIWSVREGITNILRHANARTATITLSQTNDAVELEIVNDGVQVTSLWGNGLTGLAQRAEEHGGALRTERIQDDGFRLQLKIPADGA